jgi:hypothetical protein
MMVRANPFQSNHFQYSNILPIEHFPQLFRQKEMTGGEAMTAKVITGISQHIKMWEPNFLLALIQNNQQYTQPSHDGDEDRRTWPDDADQLRNCQIPVMRIQYMG